MKYHTKTSNEGVVSVDPLPSKDELNKYYSDLYYQESLSSSYKLEYTSEEIQHKVLIADQQLYAINQVRKERSKGDALIDIGCGEGFFLSSAKKNGWKVTGVDFSSFGIDRFNPELALQLMVGDAYEIIKSFIDADQKFNACTMTNVLEHVLSPAELLNMVKQILEPGGVIAVTVPNDYSDLQNELTKTNSIDHEFWFTPPAHLHYFNLNNIERYMEEVGFTILDLYSSFPIDFFLMHPGSNYVMDKTKGRDAHIARVRMDLMMASKGIERFHELSRSYANCGVGRDLTVIIKPQQYCE